MVLLKSVPRITLNKITLVFFVFSVIHCFVQGVLHSLLYSVDRHNSDTVMSIIHEANVPQREIAWLTGNSREFKLQLCTSIPTGMANKSCTTVFDSRQGNVSIPIPDGFRRSVEDVPLLRRLNVEQNLSDSLAPGETGGVNIKIQNMTVFLDNQCTRVLVYPAQLFNDLFGEDTVLIIIQFWILGISFIAILYQSIPHLLSALVVRTLLIIGSAFATWRTTHIANYVRQLLTGENSPCGVDIFPTYFQTRVAYEISILLLNCVGLLLSSFISFKLLRSDNWRAFKATGPPKDIVRIHRLFMAFFVCLQLSSFILLTAMSLWINNLMNGVIAVLFAKTRANLGLFITSAILLLPWIILGWFAVLREMKNTMIAFLFLGIFFIASWGVMFSSLLFRWTFASCPFFFFVHRGGFRDYDCELGTRNHLLEEF